MACDHSKIIKHTIFCYSTSNMIKYKYIVYTYYSTVLLGVAGGGGGGLEKKKKNKYIKKKKFKELKFILK